MFKILRLIILLCVQCNCFGSNAIPQFSAVFDSRKKAVLIRWEHQSPGIRTYIIQRSLDDRSWDDIALQGISQNTGTRSFYFEDKKPASGENYYRLKYISVHGETTYSVSVFVITASKTNGWIMYPVPVKDVLTLEYRGAEKIKGVINVFIQQSSGKILTRLRNSSLNKVIRIPVSNLGRGIYDVRIIVEGDIVWNQRFIK